MKKKEVNVSKAVTKGVCWLALVSAIFFAFSGLTYVHSHWASQGVFIIGFAAGGLSLLKILNGIASYFPRYIASLIHWVHAISFEIFSMAFLALPPIAYLKRKTFLPAGNPKGRPILLVHGYLYHEGVWVYLRQYLGLRGFGPIYAMNLGNPFRPMEEYGKRVEKEAKRIAKETSRSDLILIGHSMGGLVSSFYALEVAPPNTVTDVITIASPLGGTLLARFGIGRNSREMEPHSAFIQRLKQKIDRESKICFYHIATKTDLVLFPYKTALVGNKAHQRCLFSDIGHMTLLLSPRVGKKLVEWLNL